MKISYGWLKEYFEDDLPEPEELARLITLHAYEVEGVVQKDGDYVLDIDVLPNRTSDSLSHDGVAKEIGAILGKRTKLKKTGFSGSDDVSTTDSVILNILDPYLVPRATKRLAIDVEIKESPTWLKERLAVLGQRSINNIVDATNLVMLETGQPVHAFDFDKIAGDNKKEIFIREAVGGEKITTLDGVDHILPAGALVIADSEKPLDIAGVKGGIASGIDANTKKVLLSACSFNSVRIRKTSRGLPLLTDASKRFEQGLSPELVPRGMDRLSALVEEFSDAKVSKDIVDVYPQPKGEYFTGVSVTEVNKVLGADLTKKDLSEIFERLGFSHELVNPREKAVSLAKELLGVPYKYGASVLSDAPREFSCSSFTTYVFARAGYSLPRMTADQLVYSEKITEKELLPGDLIFSRNGNVPKQHEVVSSKTGEKFMVEGIKLSSTEFMPGTEIPEGVSHCGIYIGDGKVIHASSPTYKNQVVEESISESLSFSNIVGYGRVIKDNERLVAKIPFERPDIKTSIDLVEEVGRMHGYGDIESILPSEESPKEVNKEFYWSSRVSDILVAQGFSEVRTYVLREEGEVELANPLAEDKSHLRDSLLPGLGDVIVGAQKHSALLEGNSIDVFEIGKVFFNNDEKVFIGIASSDEKRLEVVLEALEKELGVKLGKKSVNGLWETNFDKVMESLPEPKSYNDLEDLTERKVSYKPVSNFPYVLRDIAVWVPKTFGSSEIQKLIEENAGELLVKINLFDEYKKDEKISYAYSLVFQSPEKTLSDEEVNEIMKGVTTLLEKEGFEVR
jgi:phenylalanyl-tRNA synthetase beta subunit